MEELELVAGTELDERIELELVAGAELDERMELELVAGADELERLVVMITLDELPQLVRPYGAGWLVQVVRDTQLLPFSYPQPLVVVTHTGCRLPYQLHCCKQACKLDELEEFTTGADEDDLAGADDEVLGTEDVGPEQTAPLIVGISAAAPFLFI